MSDGAAPAPDLSWEQHVALSLITHGTNDSLSSFDAMTISQLRQAGLVTVDGLTLAPTDLGRSLAAPEGRHR